MDKTLEPRQEKATILRGSHGFRSLVVVHGLTQSDVKLLLRVQPLWRRSGLLDSSHYVPGKALMA